MALTFVLGVQYASNRKKTGVDMGENDCEIVTFEELAHRLAYNVRNKKWLLNDSILQQENLWQNKKTKITPYNQ